MFIDKLVKLFNLLVDRRFASALIKRGVAAGVEHRKVLQSIACAHVVDVGANRGQFALISRKVFPCAQIDSFEPLPVAAECFVKLFDKAPGIYMHRLAIGAKEEVGTIHVAVDDDSSSLLPISALQTTIFPRTKEEATLVVEVKPLERALSGVVIKTPALLKIDVQGYELEVLHGAEYILSQFDYIYCECSFVELYVGQPLADRVISFLADRGFILHGVYNGAYDNSGLSIQADFLFFKIK